MKKVPCGRFYVWNSLCCLVARSHKYSGMHITSEHQEQASRVVSAEGGAVSAEEEREHKHNSNRNQLEPSKLFIIQMDSFLLEFSTQIDLFTYNFLCRLLCPMSLKNNTHSRSNHSQWTLLSSQSFFFLSLTFFLLLRRAGGVTLGEGYEKACSPQRQ